MRYLSAKWSDGSEICRGNLHNLFRMRARCLKTFFLTKSMFWNHLSLRRGDPTHDWPLICCNLTVGLPSLSKTARKQR